MYRPRFLATWQMIATVVVDLRAAPARTGIAHLPEVVVGAELAKVIGRQELSPDVVGLAVARYALLAAKDCREEAIRGHLPHVGQKGPREWDRVLLEVVAEREVAEHLEERVMTERRPDVVEVVVLPAHAHALLRRRRPRVVALVFAEEDVLELVHPGVGEQQRGIVGGHKG